MERRFPDSIHKWIRQSSNFRIRGQHCSMCSSKHSTIFDHSARHDDKEYWTLIYKTRFREGEITSVSFILGLEALHLLLFARDMDTSLPAPLRAAFSGAFFSMVSSRTSARVDRGVAGWGNRHMMPRNQSREPNSRDSARKQG